MAGTPEQRVVPEDMITHLEGTYRIVSADDEISKHASNKKFIKVLLH